MLKRLKALFFFMFYCSVLDPTILKWCCKLLDVPPGMIFYDQSVRYSTLPFIMNPTAKEKEDWKNKNCNIVVGGQNMTNCSP